jgi:hypothetical protein
MHWLLLLGLPTCPAGGKRRNAAADRPRCSTSRLTSRFQAVLTLQLTGSNRGGKRSSGQRGKAQCAPWKPTSPDRTGSHSTRFPGPWLHGRISALSHGVVSRGQAPGGVPSMREKPGPAVPRAAQRLAVHCGSPAGLILWVTAETFPRRPTDQPRCAGGGTRLGDGAVHVSASVRRDVSCRGAVRYAVG